jgi:hypothetical protein
MDLAIKPSMHKEFAINERVAFEEGSVKGTGTIIGIASVHVFFTYVILLDNPLKLEGFENWRGIVMSGCQLKEMSL